VLFVGAARRAAGVGRELAADARTPRAAMASRRERAARLLRQARKLARPTDVEWLAADAVANRAAEATTGPHRCVCQSRSPISSESQSAPRSTAGSD